MKFEQKLIPGKLVRRYKRFLADVRLENGRIVTAHCPNSGSMKTCNQPGWPVLLSESRNPKRKLQYTWELVHNGRCWIGVNTHLANKLAVEAIRSDRISTLQGYSEIRTEVNYGRNSRIDILLSDPGRKCYVEVKNVTMVEADGFYKFPDSVTSRGRKHLYELRDMLRMGHRAVMLFAIQRSDGTLFKPAVQIDPAYAASLQEVYREGVEILPYGAHVSAQEIYLKQLIPFEFDV